MQNIDTNTHIDKVLFNNVIPIGMVGDMRVETGFGLNINTYYYNLSEQDVTIVTREGIRYRVSPSKKSMFYLPANSAEHDSVNLLLTHHSKSSNKIIVRKQYVLLNKDFKKFKSFVETENPPEHSFLRYVYKALCNVSIEKRPMAGTLHIPDLIDDAKVSITIDSVLDPYSGNIGRDDLYFTEEDIVISFKGLAEASSHPVTNAQSKIFVNDDAYKSSDVFISYDLVSNKNDMTLYANLSGHVVKIKSRKDKLLAEGLYKNIYSRDVMNGSHKLIEGFKVTLENMDSLGVYPTKDMAEARGNLDDARKEKIKELEYELTVLGKRADVEMIALKTELENTKAQYTEKELKDKAELEKLKAELEARKNKLTEEALVTKNHYEERSHYRKDTSESLKLAPTIITGAIGVAGAIGTVLALRASAGIATASIIAGISTMKLLGVVTLATTAILAANKAIDYVSSGDNVVGALASSVYSGVKSVVGGVWEGVKCVGGAICDGVCGFVGGLFSW